ncbi:DUF6325 family protein [Arthrobacter sp. SX1312]|uniref:DUF6325 family protein n=1 Tax=Arthrobacter sp. SX1312 TaxID=2058896 RepID=UPI0011B0427F|nr:DUF6325 family protein [Arthrobacter sp. SX1312]
MRVGPVDVLVFSTPTLDGGSRVVDALHEALDSGAVALIDIVLIARATDGTVSFADVDDGLPASLQNLLAHPSPMTLLSDRDVAFASASVGNGEVGLLLVLEHRWARRLAERIQDEGGVTRLHERVPHDAVVRAFEADGAAAT